MAGVIYRVRHCWSLRCGWRKKDTKRSLQDPRCAPVITGHARDKRASPCPSGRPRPRMARKAAAWNQQGSWQLWRGAYSPSNAAWQKTKPPMPKPSQRRRPFLLTVVSVVPASESMGLPSQLQDTGNLVTDVQSALNYTRKTDMNCIQHTARPKSNGRAPRHRPKPISKRNGGDSRRRRSNKHWRESW